MASTVAAASSCSLLLLLLLQTQLPAAAPAVGDNRHFDFFIFSREWPYSFCDVENCKNKDLLKQDFNIHGLWPQQNDGGRPMFCHEKFKVDELDPLLKDLHKNWMDLLDPNDSGVKFWKTEFKKHGSCAATDARYNSTFLYFKAALELHDRALLLPMLEKEGIKPGNQTYNVTSISRAVHKHFGFVPIVRCAGKHDQQLLYELRLCFGKDLSPMDCDTGVSRSSPLKFEAPRSLLPSLIGASFDAVQLMTQRLMPQQLEAAPLGDSRECDPSVGVGLPARTNF